jgi:hypothetical protein
MASVFCTDQQKGQPQNIRAEKLDSGRTPFELGKRTPASTHVGSDRTGKRWPGPKSTEI